MGSVASPYYWEIRKAKWTETLYVLSGQKLSMCFNHTRVLRAIFAALSRGGRLRPRVLPSSSYGIGQPYGRCAFGLVWRSTMLELRHAAIWSPPSKQRQTTAMMGRMHMW